MSEFATALGVGSAVDALTERGSSAWCGLVFATYAALLVITPTAGDHHFPAARMAARAP